MRITQWGEYAAHFCMYLAKNEASGKKSTSAAEIAKSLEIDILYAQQILQRLRKNNIIESIRGPQGGYRLGRPTAEITLKDILVAAEGDTFEIICDTKPINMTTRCTPGSHCALRGIWGELKEHVDAFLVQRTLSELTTLHEPSSTLVDQIGRASV